MPLAISRVTISGVNARPALGISALPASMANTVWYDDTGHSRVTYPYRIGWPWRARYGPIADGVRSAAVHRRDRTVRRSHGPQSGGYGSRISAVASGKASV